MLLNQSSCKLFYKAVLGDEFAYQQLMSHLRCIHAGVTHEQDREAAQSCLLCSRPEA